MHIDKDNPECHELPVLATNGRVFRFKVVEINRLFLSRYFLIALASFCMVFVLIDPKVFQQEANFSVRVLFWYSNGVLAVLLWYALFRVLIAVRRVLPFDFAVPSALMIAVTVTALIVINYLLFARSVHPGMPILGPMLYWDIFRYVGITILFETNVALFLLPRFFAELDANRDRTWNDTQEDRERPVVHPMPAPELLLADRSVTLCQVLYLKSAEHYVEVVLQDATELVRTSLKDLIRVFGAGDGVQPHRSYWVNRDAIVGMNRVKGAQFIVVKNGDEISGVPATASRCVELVGRTRAQKKTRVKPGPSPTGRCM